MLICIYLYVRQIKLTDPSARGRELNRNVPFGCHTCRVGLVDWGGGGATCHHWPVVCIVVMKYKANKNAQCAIRLR